MQFKEVRVIDTGDTKGVAEKEAELLAKHEAAQVDAEANAVVQAEEPPANADSQLPELKEEDVLS